MALKLKTRIALGGLFLFFLMLLVGGVSFYQFNKLISGSKDILKANYETVEFGKNMLEALNKWSDDSSAARKMFEENLRGQENNITEFERGEDKLTAELRANFNSFVKDPQSPFFKSAVQNGINRIIEVNLLAINDKTLKAQKGVENAKIMITIIITVCLLVAFTFILNFPGLIAGPVTKLTDAIKAISNKNYSHRIHLNRNDEFGEMATAFNAMAEQLDKYEHSNLAKLMFEKQRAETVINSLKDASIGIDNKGVILFANKHALQLLGISEAEIVGKNEDEIKVRNDLFRFLSESENKTPFKVVVDDRENFFTKENIEISNAGERLGSVIMIENITPYKEMDVAKTNFIATISHELKTPLASADFSLKLLEDGRVGQLNEEQKQLVQNLKQDNQRLLRILSELLDLSQVEMGKMQLNIQEVSAESLITKAELSVSNAAKEKNIKIQKDIGTELPPMNADAEKTVWILNNFLTNAIRYSAENSELVIKAKKLDDQFVEIGIQDFGIGIDPSFQKKIFDRYFRVPGVKDKKGTGLGLAISKDFAEAMGGEIGVKSELGKGSYFFSRFPIVNGE